MNSLTFSVEHIRKDFPILSVTAHGKPLVYFDNAATSQKPLQVIKCVAEYYSSYNSNVHRGVHTLSQLATDAMESARQTIAHHINAAHSHEIIFVRGVTEAINLVAYSYLSIVPKGSQILISSLEHHSNIVPWQLAAERYGLKLNVIPMDTAGVLDLDAYEILLDAYPTALVAVNHISNALGTINPLKKMIHMAHAAGAVTLIDGAQSIPHMEVDVRDLGADFYAISGHKSCGPTGIGALYGREELLNAMPPFMGGGEMIRTVSYQHSTWADLPFKFEAGTPNIAGAIGFGEAIRYLQGIGLDNIAAYEKELLEYATALLLDLGSVTIYGQAPEKASLISFNADGCHPYDIGTLLDQYGIAVRTGHHCAQPIMDFFQIPGTVRASFAFYNTKEEIDQFILALKKAIKMLR
ncbi:MAG: aminotransferase class V-fold PLP-dependent enzyme [Thermaurantimonas sp.]